MMECEIMRLEKAGIIRVLHEESAFSEMFTDYNGKLEVHSALLNVVLHDEPHIKDRTGARAIPGSQQLSAGPSSTKTHRSF